jgi:hypothetical protein
MNQWQLIFLQSRANSGAYDRDILPAQKWDWLQGTWFQERLCHLRETQQQRTGQVEVERAWFVTGSDYRRWACFEITTTIENALTPS